MTTLKFADTYNMVAFLAKPAESEGFEQIVDFFNAHTIRYALKINLTIYTSCIEQFWATVKAKTVNGKVQLQALVYGKKIIITESIVRRGLQLEDAEAVDSINQKFNFSKYIFESMVKNLDNVSGKFLMYPRSRRSKRKDTEVPRPSGPTTNVADEAINEEIDDSLERAATTATGLEAEQDSGNIHKTQSKATLNEPSSSGTSSGNTLQSGEDRLKLKEFMALCITLQLRVLALETTKTTQASEIASLKKRVKKLERRNVGNY
ncbi:hypothetical protein Tco_1507495 [Tanacetum coccineum]